MAAFEKHIQSGIVNYLTKQGIWYTKIHQQGRGRRGVPDLLCCYQGQFLAIEVKGERGIVSRDQDRELAAISDSGGHAIVATSVDDVRAALQRIDEHRQCEYHAPVDVVSIEEMA